MKHLVMLYIWIRRTLKQEKGSTMVEYSLMVAFIAMVVYAALVSFGTTLAGNIQNSGDLLP